MIEKLYIKNFAILDEIEVPFSKGLTVVTGETGSGKSILLQAINISLGGKSSKNMVKSGAGRAVVETKIESASFRRIIYKSGRTKSFINDEPLTESKFRNASISLVDFHGQHEQQYIMNIASHIDYLDAFCGITDLVEACTKSFEKIKKSKKTLADLVQQKQNAEEKQELLSFQMNEITTVSPVIGEDIELENEFKKIRHIDELIETVNRIINELTDDDKSVYYRISESVSSLERLVNIDSKLSRLADLLRSATINVQDTSAGLSDYVNLLNHDKERMVEIQDRLGALDNLKRKYGGSIQAVLDTQKQINEEILNYSSLDNKIDELKKIISDEVEVYQNIAIELHDVRIREAEKLAKSIEYEMTSLNMGGAKFKVQITRIAKEGSDILFDGNPVLAHAKGIDNVQFLLSANPGEKLKPLVEIASGGEISRIMLALKTVFQSVDPVDSLIFDEIDSGISGDAAKKVARSLKNLANFKQVICITHLPQIVKQATNHLHILKNIAIDKTNVQINYLFGEESKKIIAQLSSVE